MLVPSPEKSAAMKEFDAKRAQVAYINAKVAALDDEQLTLQQHLLNFEADRAALKQKFEDEVPKLRQVSSINQQNIVLSGA
jgi:predicted  nucleic acid-binding Zn-ribbon protein